MAVLAMPVARAEVDPAALKILKESAEVLGNAPFIQLSVTHVFDPVFEQILGMSKSPTDVHLKRPNKFYAIQSAGDATREIVYDGQTLCVIYPELKHHAEETVEADTIRHFADEIESRFGFRPPVAELLSEDMAAVMLDGVTLASVQDDEPVGETDCDKVHMEQEGMTIDLWVGKTDHLPRRMLITIVELPENPTVDMTFSEWNLSSSGDETPFSRRPSEDSQRVQMLKHP